MFNHPESLLYELKIKLAKTLQEAVGLIYLLLALSAVGSSFCLAQISLQFSLVLTLFSYQVSCVSCQTYLGPSPSPSSPGLVKTCLFTWMVAHGPPVRGLSFPATFHSCSLVLSQATLAAIQPGQLFLGGTVGI